MCNWFQNKSPSHTFAVDWDTWHGNWAAPCYFNGALPTGSARWDNCLQRHLACEGLYATPDWRWFWHANKIYGITAFMLNGWYRNMPVFLEDNFLILEHKVSFGFASYPSSVLIYKNRPRGNLHISPRLSCQWSVAQQKDSRPGYVALLCTVYKINPTTYEVFWS